MISLCSCTQLVMTKETLNIRGQSIELENKNAGCLLKEHKLKHNKQVFKYDSEMCLSR